MKPEITVEFGSPELFLRLGDLKISPYMIHGNHYFPLTGIHRLFGYEGKSEQWLLNILMNISKFSKVAGELIEAYENPLIANLKLLQGGTIKLIPVDLFMETCRIMVDAKNNGLIAVNFLKASKTAEKTLQYASMQELTFSIEEACGFGIFKEEMKNQLIQYVKSQNELGFWVWIKTFPDEFFKAVFKMHQFNWPDLKLKPDRVAGLLYEIVFSRIDTELLADLSQNSPKRTYRKNNRSVRDNLHPELNRFLMQVIQLVNTSQGNWFIFLQVFNRTYPRNVNQSDFPKFEAPPVQKSLSPFSQRLKKITE